MASLLIPDTGYVIIGVVYVICTLAETGSLFLEILTIDIS